MINEIFAKEIILLGKIQKLNYVNLIFICILNVSKKKIKKHIKNDDGKKNVTKYTCEELICDECKNPYPLKFYINNDNNTDKESEFSLIDVKLPKDIDYIILESLNLIDDSNSKIKNIFVVKLKIKK